MKKIYLTLCLLSLSLSAGAQCTATALYPSLSVTPTPAWTDVSSCNFAGEYALVNVTAGNLYEFSTCAANGSTITFDSELTLRSNTGALIAYSDDYCGTQSYVSWTATYTGQVQIHLHLYLCASNSICSNIRMKVTSSLPVPAPANNDCANATILAVNTSCLLTSGTTSGATEDPILDPSCDPGSINDVWYTFNSGANTSVNVTVNLVTASLVGIEIFSACGTLAPGISLGGALGNCDFNTNAPNPTVVTGLTPNTVYRFRLFTNVTYDIAGSFTVCLTVPPPPPAPTVSINSASICPGASTTLTATPSTLGGTYLWSPGGQTTQSITVSPLTTTTYSVTYTLNGVGTNNSTVTVYSPPAINAGLDISICSGQPATLTGSGGVSYTWNNGVTNNLAFNPLTTATYTVTGTDLNGCTGTDQMIVTVNANPTLSGNTVICPNTTSQLSGSGTAATSNAWTSSNAAVATVSTTGLVSALSFGTAIITYTNNNGCSATSTINVSNPTAPTFNPVAAVCSGGAIVLPSTSNNSIQGTWSPAINNTQTTTYTFTPSAGQCATTAQLSVAVNPNPSISGGNAVCSGGTLQLTGSGTAAANNAWASASTAIAGISGTGLVTGTSAGTSVVTYTNSNGCSTTATLTVNANPTLSGNTVICPNTTSQLSGSGTAATSNAWTSSNAAVATVSTTGLVSALSFGTAIITYTNNNGCSATSTINVSNPTAPTFNPVAAVCSGGAIVLPSASSNGIQGTWSPAINNTQTTTYTFTPSAGQCATTAQLSVAVNPNPSISGGNAVCSGGTLQLTGSGTAAANNAWASASTAIAGISGTGLVTGTSAGTSVVTYTNSNGCSATATLTVNANPTLSGNTVICPNTTSQLSGSGTAATSNAWTSSNAAVATVSTTGLVSALSFGTAIITYTNNNGCSATSTINVSNPTAPTFNPVAAVCSGGAIVLPSTSNNSIQGTWSPAINNTQTTTYTFTPSAGQCATTAQLSVAVNPNPSISGGNAVCSGGTLQLTGSGTAAANNAWASASTAIAGISGTGLVTGTSAGTSVVTYTNSNGCSTTATLTVNANPTLSGNTVICPNTTSQLSGSGTAATSNAWTSSNAAVATVSTTGLVSALSFGTAIITYTNNNGCSATSTINVSNPTAPTFNPVAAVCSGGAIVLPSTSNNSIQGTWSPAINNTQTTTYTFTPSAGQCATTAQLSVAVNPNPSISGGNAVCSGGTLQLTGSGTAAANNAWASASTAIAGISGNGLVTGTSAGTSVVTYTNSNGCSATASVTVNANPTANAGLDITTCVGGNVTLSGTATNGAAPYTYSWNNSIQNGVPFVALTNNTYTLTVSDGNGCSNTDQMTLTANSINWANLQWPASGNICLGQSHTIYGQIYVAGVTNGPGQAPGIVAQAGLNASNTDPSTWPLSAWSAATFNAQQGNNDEYMASVGQLQTAGTYYYTYRYSLGAGCPYFYAGFNGAWNGTSNTNGSLVINNAPNATINQSACTSYSWYGQNYTQSGTYTQTVPSGAGCDSVLYLNLTIHQPVTGPSTQQTACETYTWNGQTYTQSGAYTFNGTTQFGCDSTATLNLVIDALPSNLNVTLNGGTFTATGSNVTNYSWIDCATNTSIPNQNAATFTPTSSGSYAVVVSNNCGADTSTCEPIEVNGLSDVALPIINVYPNPSSGIFNVFSEMEITFLEILDLKGAVIYSSKPNGNLATLDLRFQADGIYVLKLRTPQNTSYFRIVKN